MRLVIDDRPYYFESQIACFISAFIINVFNRKRVSHYTELFVFDGDLSPCLCLSFEPRCEKTGLRGF